MGSLGRGASVVEESVVNQFTLFEVHLLIYTLRVAPTLFREEWGKGGRP